MSELKPCPFCGGKPYVIEDDSYGNAMIGCNCEHEPCVMLMIDEAADLPDMWNKRAPTNGGSTRDA